MSFAIMNILIKYLIDYSTFQLVFFRSLGSLIITFLILKTKKVYLWGNQKKLLIFRALSGVIAMCFFYWGAHYVSIGSAVTIRYVSPIFAAIHNVFWARRQLWVLFTAFGGLCHASPRVTGGDRELVTQRTTRNH